MAMGIEEEDEISCEFTAPMPLLALNHVSFVCRSVANSVKFYEQLLGFVLIKRPSSFNFNGAWSVNYCYFPLPPPNSKCIIFFSFWDLRRLYNYGIGIHLLEESEKAKGVRKKPQAINPKDNHISFHHSFRISNRSVADCISCFSQQRSQEAIAGIRFGYSKAVQIISGYSSPTA
ncbi:hypothetical protein ACLOJK_027848 [Asimina triloba]